MSNHIEPELRLFETPDKEVIINPYAHATPGGGTAPTPAHWIDNSGLVTNTTNGYGVVNASGHVHTLIDQGTVGNWQVNDTSGTGIPLATLNGRTAVGFTAASRWFNGPSLASFTEADMFMVLQTNEGVVYNVAPRFGTSGSSDHYQIGNSAIGWFSSARFGIGDIAPYGVSAPHILHIRSSAAGWIMKINGVTVWTDVTNTFAASTAPHSGSNFNGLWGELRIFGSILDSGDTAAVMTDLAAEWGI